ncbi:MAG: A/G-specific adenine glycosylase [Opitutaceae bacterium]|nr:A/G-specific adenine glycosylase [Opitutaceae bacterium]
MFPIHRAEFRSALLAWYRRSQRALPWRLSPSIYRTVVSEFMLQQTQVKTVLPYFERWNAKFPDFESLASASESDVLRQWEGLGYYSRARNLHRLAREIVASPVMPSTAKAWLELPGVGPYTAAAITSIAFGRPEACVDGNVVRILARLTGDTTRHRDSATAARHFAPLASELLSTSSPGDHNQAMMELGATVCGRNNPLCHCCPVARWCAATRSGSPETFPQFLSKKIEHRSVTRAWVVRGDALLLHRSPPRARRLANLHELPSAADLDLGEQSFDARDLLAKRRRGITRYVITESIYRVTPPKRLRLGDELVWVRFDELPAIAISGPHRRWITELLGTQAVARRNGIRPSAPRQGQRAVPTE